MDIGDLVEREHSDDPAKIGERYLVSSEKDGVFILLGKIDPKTGSRDRYPLFLKDVNEYRVLCNPILKWPCIQTKYQFLKVIDKVNLEGSTRLQDLTDWVIIDSLRPKGLVHFNPRLGLKTSDSLMFTYQGKTDRDIQSTVILPRTFLTGFKPLPKKPPVRSMYERLRNDDD